MGTNVKQVTWPDFAGTFTILVPQGMIVNFFLRVSKFAKVSILASIYEAAFVDTIFTSDGCSKFA
jgi:hypothetical protein